MEQCCGTCALTRQGFVDRVLHLNRTHDNLPSMRAELLQHDAALRDRIAQQQDQWRKTNAQYESAAKAVTRLTTQLAAMTAERDAALFKHDELAAILIANQVQVQTVQRNRELRAHVASLQAALAARGSTPTV